ncbi:hypothetical protein SLEP1_g30113 [Rubroshorea leprosula]|uniref:Uncharacterized protein n=1 Tax=Rubroshorea leprosula TaxID=152421 RepID=A0AAV5JZ14_9ROSI|nr:hypothetical protein SLEP1_g30113 [Rubroshorea leprosula]
MKLVSELCTINYLLNLSPLTLPKTKLGLFPCKPITLTGLLHSTRI